MPFIKSNLRILGNQMEPFRFFFGGLYTIQKTWLQRFELYLNQISLMLFPANFHGYFPSSHWIKLEIYYNYIRALYIYTHATQSR